MARVSPTTAPGGARRPTLRDVARLAGVGVKTASRVVTEEGGVSPAKVEAVRAAVAELGYVPDAAARGLRRGDRRAGVVAVLLEDLSNPFSASVLRAVEDVVRPRGLVVVAGSLDEDPEQERRLVRAVLGRRTDGLVLMPAGGDHGWLARELEAPGGALLGGVLGRAVPVVFVDRAPVGVVADAVRADDRDGARGAVAHLAAAGHRRVALLADDPAVWTAQERLAGYRDGLAAAGLPHDPALERTGLRSEAAAGAAVLALLDAEEPPTALFTAQRRLTAGAVRALLARGRERDVAVVGFDDVAFADLLRPAVSVVAQDPGRIGALAAELLLRRLDGDRSAAQDLVVPTRLVPRGSGELRPVAAAP